jgi:ABC-type Fe3+ transport system substrate-binding protein
MGIFDRLRGKPSDVEVVFAGDRMEAELVMRILQEEGFHPREWADLPAPSYAGPIGMARVVVPPAEAESARAFLAELELSAGEEAEGEGDAGPDTYE